MGLRLIKQVDLPKHPFGGSGFDHGDVYNENGKVFVAHTANGSIEVIYGNGPNI